jgi:hypothetical protein
VIVMVCPNCVSRSVEVVPAEIRLYRDGPRKLSHPPLKPSPDILVCLDCGWAEFSIPRAWLSAGWMRPTRPKSVMSEAAIEQEKTTAA